MTDLSTLSRRGFLRGTAGLAVAGSLAGCYYSTSGSDSGNVSSGGVGSGFAYEQPDVSREDATHVVRSPDQFDAALDEATHENPSIVWIPADAAINYSGRSRVVTNAVIASSRSVNHPGGLIYSNTMGGTSEAYRGGPVDGVLELGANSRMTGVRYRGPTSATWEHPLYPGYIPFGSGPAPDREEYRSQRHSRGISITSGNVRIDNCEIFGWSTQAISVNCPRSWGRERDQSHPRIQNSSIHDCGLSGYGYGLEVNTGHPVCERSYFNGCRHMVAGEGYPDCGYTLSGCFFGPAGSLFPIDMHNLAENIGGTTNPDDYEYRYRSGGLMRVLNCTVAFSHVIDIASTESGSLSAGGNPFAGEQTSAISIGGLPAQGVQVAGCRFVHDSPDSAFSQGLLPRHAETNQFGLARWESKNNQFGLTANFPVGQP
ncbi:hypothetical protein HacjB3_19343 (plasmid) [Halalkalicoccus jeotgali B3]|uniref:Right handed beta helix domain-containing protein n=1 Tax=Halalkalicoccus jeotgali (strain DSM 18796 / CECT 7217 / JCM 14584 / KCTC 4019 / B3) TaxID=795797 RepID=D8JCR6_HALJB|nr:twin-arginine translocation signal domain-containing protein [Halalkalicoccus jeotgali]ADJ16811.1 hypothetical protein HacjB3_17343 [Halalkalicoccus jeotgali B3]ADJ17205.1 hypothetical protein HacjB3_19343 [Halalkalicoccus jeotgali B3]